MKRCFDVIHDIFNGNFGAKSFCFPSRFHSAADISMAADYKNMADSTSESVEFEEWLGLTRLTEYAEVLKENGFDDISLLKSMEIAEVDEMIQIIDMKKKGHILKMKKCISMLKSPCAKINIQHSVKENIAERAAESKQAQPTVPKQSILCFSKGKFVCQKPKDPAPATPPWQYYSYPAPKTERLKFFNQVT